MRERAAGALDDARRRCQSVLDEHPDHPAALNLMAEIDADEMELDRALTWAERALAVDPGAAPRYTLGRIHESGGRLVKAEAFYRDAIRVAPDHAKAHNNLGAVLHVMGRLDEALASYRRALDIDPALPEASQNYGSIAREPAILEAAVEGYRRQVAANPGDALAHNHLGNTLRELGRYDEALAQLDKAVQIDPELAEAHFSRAFLLLLRGDYRAGWREYEWRWGTYAFAATARRFAKPRWDGRRMPGTTMLLHAEQGLGDTLQFVRYMPLVAINCENVVLEVQPELKTLLQPLPGVRQVLAQGEPLPPFDLHMSLMSLPWVLHTSVETIPWHGPYVKPDPARVAKWRELASPHLGALNVGLVWAGRPQQWDDPKRSLTLDALAPLGKAGATFFSLQIGEAAAQAARPPAGMALHDLTPHIGDFSDTAALASLLDLVVTIDTSVAHLGGAMGLPTWVLVAYAPDWRYHLGRDDNPWYPSMRLFRQSRDGIWTDAVERVTAELAKLRASR